MPIHPGEFFTHGECAIQECPACGAGKSIPADIMCMTFGDDFDMRAGARSLQNAFSCSICDTPRPKIRFEDELSLSQPADQWEQEPERLRA